MKESKLENIHHFADEFALEDIKDKTGVDHAHPSKPHRTKDGQFAHMQMQIANLTKRVKQLEKILENKM